MLKRIEQIQITHTMDTWDIDYIGTFDDKAKDEFAIDHHERSGQTHYRFQYFNPQPGTCETNEHAEQSYKRMMDYERGDWHMIGISAVAIIQTSTDGISWLQNEIASGGLWGIESDSDAEYLKEIADEQTCELYDVLKTLGFDLSAISSVPVNTVNA